MSFRVGHSDDVRRGLLVGDTVYGYEICNR